MYLFRNHIDQLTGMREQKQINIIFIIINTIENREQTGCTSANHHCRIYK